MKLNRFDLTFSYGYLVTKEKDSGDVSYYPRISDQRHTASMAVTWMPGNKWTIYLRAFYGSGYAYTPSYVAVDSATMISRWVEGAKNYGHYPAYERVDVRFAKSFLLFNNPAQVYLDITNLFNRRNIWSYDYTYDRKGNPIAQPLTLLGIIPVIGLSYNCGS